jgi:quercetin dioxygenase-like cupin family protein
VQREGGAIEEIRPGDVVWFELNEKHGTVHRRRRQ